MKLRKLNWPLWLSFILSICAFVSYPFIFVWFPLTRDFPWANLLLFMIAAILMLLGIRRAFAPDHAHPKRTKIIGSIVASVSVAIFGLFVFTAFIGARNLPGSLHHPQVGQKAPDFTLVDTSGKSVSLSELLTSQINGKPVKGVLMIFYRGYW